MLSFLSVDLYTSSLLPKLLLSSSSAVASKFEVSTALQFQENRRHGMDGRTDRKMDGVQYLMRPPEYSRIIMLYPILAALYRRERTFMQFAIITYLCSFTVLAPQ